jgi:DNA-binding transcriptional LysR family regulator
MDRGHCVAERQCGKLLAELGWTAVRVRGLMEANASDFEFHKLRERRLDLMIGRIEGAGVDDDLNVEVLCEEPIHVVVGARNPLADRSEIILADLMNERWMIVE